jgi:very-short-patch-repair endonuclease
MKHYPKSALEDRVELLLNKHKIPFTREFKVGRFHLDFLIGERIDLECDGEFYHSLPEAAKKDKRRDHILKKMGYRIIRLSGKSITKNPERCLNRITRMIEKMEE